MSTRFILTHPYFPQTMYRFRHIWHRAHARLETGSELYRSAVWDCFGDAIVSFYWLLRAGVGNWVKIRLPKPIVP